MSGYTGSSNFPTTPGGFDTSHNGGTFDAFVTKLDPTGSALAYSTFLGGGSDDLGVGMAVDASGSAYVSGQTGSSSFPTTPGAFDTSHNGGTFDAFVTKLDPTGSALAYSTFLGGGNNDVGYGIAADASGNAYVTSYTVSSNFPTTPGALDTSHNGALDAFVTKLDPAGSVLAYSTFLGGGSDEVGHGIAVDASGSAYVTGYTVSSGFPTTPGAFDTSHNGGADSFVTKFSTVNASADLSMTKVDTPDPVVAGANLTYTITVSNAGPSGATGVALSDPLPAGVTLVSVTPSQGSCAPGATVSCGLGSIASGGARL